MVALRGLEGSERKTENWTANRSRPMVEDDRDLKHPVYEKKGPPDVLCLCSSAVPVIDCEERCPGSPIDISRSPLLSKEIPFHSLFTTRTHICCTIRSIK